MADISSSSLYLAKNNIKLDPSIKSGVVILEINENGPSKAVGLKVGDVIIKLNDDKIETSAKLKYYLSKNKVGDTVTLVVKRETEELSFKVTLMGS
jgi:serine protease Do